MKKILPVAFTLFVLACNDQSSNENQELKLLYHERDSLMELFSNVSEQLKQLEEQITLMDTSIKVRSVLVSTQILKPERFEHFVEVHGILESEKNVTLNSEINGIVRQIKIAKGQSVQKGETIVLLDHDFIQRNIDEVETAYELANTLFQRQEKLWKQNIGSEIQFLESKNRKESLEQKLKTLRTQKEMTVIKAPFSGIVDDVFIKEGEMANPMTPLIRLINGENFYVTADLPENYLKAIKTGSEVHVKLPSLDQEIISKIKRVGQFINPYNRTFKIQVDLENSSKMLRPNLLSVLMVKTFEADSAAVVPSTAIQQDAKGIEYVFVVNRKGMNSSAKRVNVITSATANNKTLISKGLTGNEEIVVEGARGLKEDEIIEIAN